jgi:hypothetical protein
MKKLVLLICLAISYASFAQEPTMKERKRQENFKAQKERKTGVTSAVKGETDFNKSPEQRTSEIMNELTASLNLSSQQKNQIENIISEREKQKQRDHEQYSQMSKDFDLKVRERHKEYESRLESVMSKEQYRSYRGMKEKDDKFRSGSARKSDKMWQRG